MSHLDGRVDATFYQMIHQYALREDGDDRRRHQRRRYPNMQWIAPWDGDRFPKDSEFIEVRCHDLTPGGFSFLYPRQPQFDLLVAGFGLRPSLLFVGAGPVRFTPVLMFASGHVHHLRSGETQLSRRGPNAELGRPMILVGCRFIRRLERPPAGPRA